MLFPKKVECSEAMMAMKKPNQLSIVNFKLNSDIDERLPSELLNTDESYTLTISEDADEGLVIEANQYSGIVRAISTLSYLIQSSEDHENFFEIVHAPLQINDSPRYPYRGFMMDTSRHYFSVARIKEMVYALSLSKFNVLHWHLVDDDSFPMQLDSFPDITKNGAYSADKVYTNAQMKEVVDYATSLAIRVIPEFDNPGHTRSIGLDPEFKEIIRCFDKDWPNTPPGAYKINGGPPTGVLDPLYDKTYELIKGIFTDMNAIFPD